MLHLAEIWYTFIFLHCCRHAYNIQIREVNVFVTKAIVEFPLRGQSSIEPPQYLAKFKRVSCAAFSLIVIERISLVSSVFDKKYVLLPLALDWVLKVHLY